MQRRILDRVRERQVCLVNKLSRHASQNRNSKLKRLFERMRGVHCDV